MNHTNSQEHERSIIETISQQLACLVEKALIAEVELSPKPGLVDALDCGSHKDMDKSLFMRSAHSLTPYFQKMAELSWRQPLNADLREAIAEIGRTAEKKMYSVTNGINTHKGAIWTMGLFISVVASQFGRNAQLTIAELFQEIAALAAFPDKKNPSKQPTHGQCVAEKYGLKGAYGEALQGYPHVQAALKDHSTDYPFESPDMHNIHLLLTIMSTLEDTCVIYRSDVTVLKEMQRLAREANKKALPNAAYQKLMNYCQNKQISPGGSADLLAASFFVLDVQGMTIFNGFLQNKRKIFLKLKVASNR